MPNKRIILDHSFLCSPTPRSRNNGCVDVDDKTMEGDQGCVDVDVDEGCVDVDDETMEGEWQ